MKLKCATFINSVFAECNITLRSRDFSNWKYVASLTAYCSMEIDHKRNYVLCGKHSFC
jgi:hypothetical protein